MSLIFDWETRSSVDLIDRGVYVYSEHPATDVLLASFKLSVGENETFNDAMRAWIAANGPLNAICRWRRPDPCPPYLRAYIEAGGEVCAFNAAFERLMWWNVATPKYGWPKPKLEQFRCTAVTAAAMSLPRSLDALSSAMDLKIKKDKGGKDLIKIHSSPAGFDGEGSPVWHPLADDPVSMERFHQYCDVDVLAEEEAHNRLIPLSDEEMKVYWLNERINDRGLRIDIGSAYAALKIADAAKTQINGELNALTDGAVPAVTLTARMKEWVHNQGVEIAAMDKDEIDETLHLNLPDNVRRALELRIEGGKASVEKLHAMLRSTTKDGTVKGVFLHHGAGQTGRFCVAGDTAIDTPYGYRYIVNLQPGDYVRTHLNRLCEVTALIHKGREEMFQLYGLNGETVTATAGHRILTHSGWRRIDECFEKGADGRFTLRRGHTPISLFDNDCWRRSEAVSNYDAYDDGYFEGEYIAGRIGAFAGRQPFAVEDREGQPYVWSASRSGAYFAERARSGLERKQLHLRASADSRSDAGVAEIAEPSCGASHRWGQNEQRSRQSGDLDAARAYEATQANSWSLICVGEREVWDISVAGDASYTAQGLIHHNSSKLCQVHNMPRPRKVFEDAHVRRRELFEAINAGDPAMLQLFYGPELGRPLHLLADALRSFIWAAPGHKFIGGDFSSIEGRVAAWYGRENWKLQAYRELDAGRGAGLYELAAAGIYGIPVQEVTKQQRSSGKIAELALGFGGGVGALARMARSNKVDLALVYPGLWEITDQEGRDRADDRYEQNKARKDATAISLTREAYIAAELIKTAWRKKHPGTVQAWRSLVDAAFAAVQNPGAPAPAVGLPYARYVVAHGFLWLQLPSGRCLAYGMPEIRDVEVPWADKTLEPSKREKQPAVTVRGVGANNAWMRYPLNLSICYNNLVQATARDIMVNGMFNVEEAGYPVKMHVHDEIVAELPNHLGSVKEFEELMCRLPKCYVGLPIAAAGFTLKRYAKT